MYSFLYRYFFYPLLFISFKFLALFNPKIQKALDLRSAKDSKPENPAPQNHKLPWLNMPGRTRPIWFHCASGEFEYAKPVINALKLKYPEIKILVTYFSPSILDSLEKFKNLDYYCPAPWDEPKFMQEFLSHHAPRALLIARTDAWPEMLAQVRKNQIPSLLFSATLAKNSSRMSWLARGFTAWTLKMLSEIQCVSLDDFENFKQLGVENITKICGDTRYDQVIDRLKHPKPIKDPLFRHSPSERIFVAGSTWPEDEEVLLELIRASQKNNLKFKFVIVPHEPTESHMASLKQKALALDLKIELYSKVEKWNQNNILVVDQIGILAEIYAYAAVAFVGGSFKKSVHSVMEPLAAGCLTFIGPKHQNNREALFMKALKLKQLAQTSPVIEVKNTKDFLKQLKQLGKVDFPPVSKEIKKLIEERAGEATGRALQWLAPYLTK